MYVCFPPGVLLLAQFSLSDVLYLEKTKVLLPLQLSLCWWVKTNHEHIFHCHFVLFSDFKDKLVYCGTRWRKIYLFQLFCLYSEMASSPVKLLSKELFRYWVTTQNLDFSDFLDNIYMLVCKLVCFVKRGNWFLNKDWFI